MILADTSAWILLLRGSGHPVRQTLIRLIEDDADVVVTEPVVMEVLAGARSDRHARELRRALLAFPLVRIEGLASYEEAAIIHRICRRGGETVRSLVDCLIAVVAMREGAEILHHDADFEVIARHTELRIHQPGWAGS